MADSTSTAIANWDKKRSKEVRGGTESVAKVSLRTKRAQLRKALYLHNDERER